MTYLQTLYRVETRAIASLFACALIVAVLFALEDLSRTSGSGTAFPIAGVAFQVTFLLGLVPVTVIGAPLYAWLQTTNRLSWKWVAALGIAPGAALVPFGASLGATAIACGIGVAVVTHYLARGAQGDASRSNNRIERSQDA